jgi:membrane protein required for colicin V production
MLKGIDKMLGVIFGFLRASVVVVVLIVLSESFTGVAHTDGWQQSRLIVPFEKLSTRVLDELSNVDVDVSSVIPSAES